MSVVSKTFLIGTGAFSLAACATTVGAPADEAAADLPAKPAAPVYALDDFLGKAPASIDALLGEPALTRREGEGEYRRYALSECSLIVILYPDDGGAVRAAHIEATALKSGEDKPDLTECLAAG